LLSIRLCLWVISGIEYIFFVHNSMRNKVFIIVTGPIWAHISIDVIKIPTSEKKKPFLTRWFLFFYLPRCSSKSQKNVIYFIFFSLPSVNEFSWIECLPLPSWREENSVVDRSVFWVKKLKCYSVKNEKWKPGDHIFPYKFLLLSFENKLSRAMEPQLYYSNVITGNEWNRFSKL